MDKNGSGKMLPEPFLWVPYINSLNPGALYFPDYNRGLPETFSTYFVRSI